MSAFSGLGQGSAGDDLKVSGAICCKLHEINFNPVA